MDIETLQFEMVALLSYLAVSARGCVDEPPLYGPFRLVDAVSRLIKALEAAGLSGEGWAELGAYVDENKYTEMDEASAYSLFLDEVVARVVPLLEAA